MATNDLKSILVNEPKFRLKQVYRAWFDLDINSYAEITTLSKNIRENLKNYPWLSVRLKKIQESKLDGTKKALLEFSDGETAETVLMSRADKSEDGDRGDRYTVCLSSQAGCPMGCAFCATGGCGFKRDLTAFEIIDQLRFWQKELGAEQKISNIVLMGQGEPFLNYENVKEALNIILENTEIGSAHITVSTVGIKQKMEAMLEDKNFPPVRFALSLHSAREEVRSKIMPASRLLPPARGGTQRGGSFLEFLVKWSKKYHAVFSSRSHFIGLEYIMLKGINDGPADLKALIALASKLGRVRINLIPFNNSPLVVRDPEGSSDPRRGRGTFPPIKEGSHAKRGREVLATTLANTPLAPLNRGECQTSAFQPSDEATVRDWHDKLLKSGFVATIRLSQGQDISAACGQLKNNI